MSSVDSSTHKSGKHPVKGKLQSLRSAQSNADIEKAMAAKRPAETRLTSKDLKRPLYVIKESDCEDYEDDSPQKSLDGGNRTKTTDAPYEGDLEEEAIETMSLKKEIDTTEIVAGSAVKPFNEKEYIYEVGQRDDTRR